MSKTLLNALDRPALIIAADGRISAANAPAIDLLGDAILGRHYITALRQPSLLDAIEHVEKTGEKVEARYLTTEARRDITMTAHCAALKPDDGIFVLFEDHTAVEEAEQIRRDFVANVSHELRTPLTALLGFIETLQGAAKNDPESQARFLDIVKREAGRMNRLVGDLLSLSRVEAEARVRPTDEVDLASVARSVAVSLGPVAKEAGVDLVLNGADGTCIVPGDADQLSQVVTNLVENGVKYSSAGAKVTVELRDEDHNAMVRGRAAVISVTDTGEGIDPIHIPRLTERFYRIDNHRSRELGGTGLGLAIVKHIINRHRGRLRIESKLEKGSRFTVILPAAV